MTDQVAAPVSRRLSAGDQALLQWFLGAGAIMFERTTMGHQLDRAELFSRHHAQEASLARGDGSIYPRGELTAQPTAEVRQVNGVAPDDEALRRYARASRQLLAVERMDALSADVLRVYYGDEGAVWGGKEARGRMFALYRFTDAGQKLLAPKKSGKSNGYPRLEVSQALRLDNILAANERKPHGEIKRVFRLADMQAREVYLAACLTWNRAKPAWEAS